MTKVKKITGDISGVVREIQAIIDSDDETFSKAIALEKIYGGGFVFIYEITTV